MPELATQRGRDDGLDRALSQKAPSPRAAADSVADAFTDVRPNAVLHEKSANAERDLGLAESGARTGLAAGSQWD
eukprot:512207-Pyramimonas_sp.AAC.1